MTSLILRTATRLLLALMLLFSFFLFIRGHNEPGGGFIGGLVGAGAFALFAIAYGAAEARQMIRIDPRAMLALGLLFAGISGVLSMLAGTPYLTGLWYIADVGGTTFHIGTPLLFDIGVYLVVIGATLAIIFSLEEEQE